MENNSEISEKWYEKKTYIIALCCTGGMSIGLITGYPFGVYHLWKSDKFTQWHKIVYTALPVVIQLLSIYKVYNK